MAQEESKEPKRRHQTLIMNNQQMLREIRESLKHLQRGKDPPIGTPSDQARTVASASSETNSASSVSLASSNSGKFHNQARRFSGSGHAETLAKIRSSLEPYAASESGYSSCSESSNYVDINRQFLHQLVAIGFDEVSTVLILKFVYKIIDNFSMFYELPAP